MAQQQASSRTSDRFSSFSLETTTLPESSPTATSSTAISISISSTIPSTMTQPTTTTTTMTTTNPTDDHFSLESLVGSLHAVKKQQKLDSERAFNEEYGDELTYMLNKIEVNNQERIEYMPYIV
jgi:hypothetical protein